MRLFQGGFSPLEQRVQVLKHVAGQDAAQTSLHEFDGSSGASVHPAHFDGGGSLPGLPGGVAAAVASYLVDTAFLCQLFQVPFDGTRRNPRETGLDLHGVE